MIKCVMMTIMSSWREMMDTVSVVEARKKFSDLMARVAYAGQRIVVERRGKPMVAWISIEDLHQLEKLEKGAGPVRVRRQAALALAAASRQRIRAERGGVPLPDSTDVLTRLREGRIHEFANMR
jgi:prevent-host-death family protein